MEPAIKLRTLLFTCVLLALLLGIALGSGRAQDISTAPRAASALPRPFEPVRWGTWPYKAIDALQKAGVVIGYPDGTYPRDPRMTRYEFAVSIARMFPLLMPTIPSLTETQRSLLKSPQARRALIALINEFQPELEVLVDTHPKPAWPGVSVAGIKARLAKLDTPPFPDVPPNHWASSLVETVRQFGLLLGYPNGAFETSDGHD